VKMEFKLIVPSEKEFQEQSCRAITFNKEEIEEYVKERIGKYEGRYYDETQIREAKADRADMNKFKEAIEAKRKEIKAIYMLPYEKFAEDVSEIVSLINKPIKEIDGQIKEYEERQKEEKKSAIESVHAVHITPYENILPLSKIFNPKWLNAAYKLQEIVKEIIGIRERFEKDIEVIRSLKSEYESQIKDKYIETLDLTAALEEKTRLEEQKKRLLEIEEQKGKDLSFKDLSEAALELQSPIKTEERKIEVSFKVIATERQLNGLKTFLEEQRIQYERIDEGLPKKMEMGA
jgi:hypothetical protein